MKNKYIQYTDFLKQEQNLKNLKSKGFKVILKKSKIKLIGGLICLFLAIIPNGTGFFMFPLSFLLLGISLNDFLKYKEDIKFKIYERLRK